MDVPLKVSCGSYAMPWDHAVCSQNDHLYKCQSSFLTLKTVLWHADSSSGFELSSLSSGSGWMVDGAGALLAFSVLNQHALSTTLTRYCVVRLNDFRPIKLYIYDEPQIRNMLRKNTLLIRSAVFPEERLCTSGTSPGWHCINQMHLQVVGVHLIEVTSQSMH